MQFLGFLGLILIFILSACVQDTEPQPTPTYDPDDPTPTRENWDVSGTPWYNEWETLP